MSAHSPPRPARDEHPLPIVVVGGGVVGLGAALGLARAGFAVRVLERDSAKLPSSAASAFAQWERPGAPQLWHSHAFLARLRNLLRARLPDVLARLLAAGASEMPLAQFMRPELADRSAQPGDEELTLLACRRSTFEWVLRMAARAEPLIEFCGDTRVRGLLREGERIVGVHTCDDAAREHAARPTLDAARGQAARPTLDAARGHAARPTLDAARGHAARLDEIEMSADAAADAGREVPAHASDDAAGAIRARLVVDASGRRSKLPAWLRAAGLPQPEERSEPCGIFYCSRFYRLRPGATAPPRDTPIGADLGFFKYAIFHGDAGVFSITLAARPHDRPLRALLKADAFHAVARALPATARWVDPLLATPISRVYAMDGLRNTHRRFARADGSPLAPGVVAIGDAAIHTNPLYGRGCSLGLLHAFLLVDAVVAHADDPHALARELAAQTGREIVPWYEFTCQQDREARIRAARADEAERVRNSARAEGNASHHVAGAEDEAARANTAKRAADETDAARDAGAGRVAHATAVAKRAAGDGLATNNAARASDAPAAPASQRMREVIEHGLLPALRSDAVVLRAFLRSFNLLDPPGSLLRNPGVLRRIAAVYQQREARPPEPAQLDRAALLRILARFR